MAVALAERAFRLEQLGIDQAFDHDLGVGRHVEVDGDAFAIRIGAPASPPATAISSRSIGELHAAR